MCTRKQLGSFLCPEETPLNVHVQHVECTEHGCEWLSGALYMTTFRLIFAPAREAEENRFVSFLVLDGLYCPLLSSIR